MRLPRLSWPRVLDVVIVAVAAAIALGLVRQRADRPVRLSEADWRTLTSGSHQLGDSIGSVTVVEFVDYRCPACRTAEGVLAAIEGDPEAALRRVIRIVPVHRATAGADTAALLAICAAPQGRFEQMHRTLFANPGLIQAADWDSLEALAGIADRTRLRECVGSPSALRELMGDRDLAEAFGVATLPTLVVDRVWMSGMDAAHLRDALLARLR